MASKYHIDANGKVVPCTAKIRKCPRTDYSSVEAAQSALMFQDEATRLETERERLQRDISDRNSPSKAFLNINANTAQKNGNSPRKIANDLERRFFETGVRPDIISANLEFIPNGFTPKTANTSLQVRTYPTIDVDNAKVVNTWNFILDKNANKKNGLKNVEEITLDLDNDFDSEIHKVDDLLFKVAQNNMHYTTPPQDIKAEANRMKQDFLNAFMSVQDEAKGSFWAWEVTGGKNSVFEKSDYATVRVQADYETTTFRAESFDRFLEDNPEYKANQPSVELFVHDDENGKSDNAWGISFNNTDGWCLYLKIDGEDGFYNAPSPEETEKYMYDFIKAYMKTDDDTTAHEKSAYISDLMVGVDKALAKNLTRRRDIMQQDRERRNRQHSKRLFGDNNSSTMKNIVNMFA